MKNCKNCKTKRHIRKTFLANNACIIKCCGCKQVVVRVNEDRASNYWDAINTVEKEVSRVL